ncbi:multiubiquitin domain-containing protein [Methylobacterium fujisawaense]
MSSPDNLGRGSGHEGARSFRFELAFENLQFRPLELPDPVPLGSQILREGGYHPPDDFSLFAILPTGDFEDVRPDEPFDLREKGVERFVAFHTDRDFTFMMKDARITWGKPGIAGADLYLLAGVGADEAVFLDIPGGSDRLIDPEETFDLSEPGVEHFRVAHKPPTEIEIIVNARPYTVVGTKVTFEQIVQLAFPGSAPAANVIFTMTYRRAASEPHAGSLAVGGSVDVKKGSIFNVTRTVQS